MTGPATPGQEGPSYAPPPLPEGWIAQWDGNGRKYYFVQLSTGTSQWDTPTHPAPTGPTPQATPQGGLEHPYGTPARADGQIPADGDRSLGGNIGNFAMNQLLGGGKKQSHGSSGSSNPLMGLAGQFLGGGGKQSSSGSAGHSSSPAAGIVGGLVGSFMGGGKKPEHQQTTNYSGSGQTSQGQSHSGGFMDSVGGMFGGHHGSSQQQGGQNFGYSQHNSSQGGYSGAAPPASYQPAGAAHTQYNAPPPQHNQQPQHGAPQHGTPQSGYPPQSAHSQSYDPNAHSYGAPAQPQHGQQPNYGGPPQAPYSPPYGGAPQNSYSSPPPQQYPGPPSYGQPGAPQQYGGGQPQHGGPPPHTGNIPAPQHTHFQGLHNAEHSGGLYGNAGGSPQVPMGSHPGQQQYGGGPPGGYGGQQPQQRW